MRLRRRSEHDNPRNERERTKREQQGHDEPSVPVRNAAICG
jgi:hypothetical protein